MNMMKTLQMEVFALKMERSRSRNRSLTTPYRNRRFSRNRSHSRSDGECKTNYSMVFAGIIILLVQMPTNVLKGVRKWKTSAEGSLCSVPAF